MLTAMKEQSIGLALAISSSIFIGSSFIIKKRGLRVAGASGLRAGGNRWSGGFVFVSMADRHASKPCSSG